MKRRLLSIARKIKKRLIHALIKKVYLSSKYTDLLDIDFERWIHLHMFDSLSTIEELYLYSPEFRTLFFHRLRIGNKYVKLLHAIYPPLPTLYICTSDIGGGLFIQHGFSTIIAAKKIGENCWINQQVTIGYSNTTDAPTIGDDVSIHAGAQVIGNVTIGDRSRIGAGAVVVKSVPADCTVVGNPAFIVKRNGLRVNEKL
jgi:serine O-acetyltransferase